MNENFKKELKFMYIFSSFPSASSAFLAGIIFIATALVNIIFAIAVYVDGNDNGTRLVWPSIWGLVTLIGGPLSAAAYWIVCRLKLETAESNGKALIPISTEDKIAQHRAKINSR